MSRTGFVWAVLFLAGVLVAGCDEDAGSSSSDDGVTAMEDTGAPAEDVVSTPDTGGVPPEDTSGDATTPEDAGADASSPEDAGPPVSQCVDGWCLIPAGSFTMGSPPEEPCRDGYETAHTVTLTRAVWMASTEVTQDQWSALIPTNPSTHKACGSCPVDFVNWHDAAYYANALSTAEGLPECYTLNECSGTPGGAQLLCASVDFAGLDCAGYRLPTEAEWEYAARAGTSTAYWSGENAVCMGQEPALDPVAWYGGHPQKTGTTHPVGLLQPNAFGLYDVMGNVAEWVWDAWDQGADYSLPAPADPIADTGGLRILRGGNFGNAPDFLRSAKRQGFGGGTRGAFTGFRLVRTEP